MWQLGNLGVVLEDEAPTYIYTGTSRHGVNICLIGFGVHALNIRDVVHVVEVKKGWTYKRYLQEKFAGAGSFVACLTQIEDTESGSISDSSFIVRLPARSHNKCLK